MRDTQVGLKVFRREVAEEVLPLLLVKQFAFDLEFLAVARALGYGRIREQPVTLQYRFTGSGVRSIAVLLALIDTAAIFYRLRILRYYQRKRELLPAYERTQDYRPSVTLVASVEPSFEYEGLDRLDLPTETPEGRAEALRSGASDVVAFLEDGAVPGANWLDATVPFLANPRIAAVVTPSLAPAHGPLRERAAAALQESFIGGGSHYFRFTPGNLRFVKQFPGANLVARRAYCLELPDADLHPDRICAALAGRGRFVLYTPETVVVGTTASTLPAASRDGRGSGACAWAGGAAARSPRADRSHHFPRSRCSASRSWAGRSCSPGAVGAPRGCSWQAAIWRSSLRAAPGRPFASVPCRVGALAALGSACVHFTYGLALLRGLLRG